MRPEALSRRCARRAAALFALAGGAFVVAVPAAHPAAQPDSVSPLDVRASAGAPRWRLLAVEYARSRGVPERRLVRGAPVGSRVDMSWYYFVALGHGRVVLIDCGTDALSSAPAGRLATRWAIARAVPVVEALGATALSPADVTDIVLTHHHWDHAGGLGRFPAATVHVHRGEWSRIPARLRRPVEAGGRLDAIASPPRELWPGFTVGEAGRHTRHHLMVTIDCPRAPVTIAGDAAYLYRNIDERRPVTVTTDAAHNVADVERAVREVGASRVLPGHDPELFERFPATVAGVAEICPVPAGG